MADIKSHLLPHATEVVQVETLAQNEVLHLHFNYRLITENFSLYSPQIEEGNCN